MGTRHTSLVGSKQSLTSLRRFFGNLSSAFEGLISKKHHIFFGDRAVLCQPVDSLRWASELSYDVGDPVQRSIRNIVLSSIDSCEKKQSGSGFILLSLVTEMIRMPHPVSLSKGAQTLSSRTRRCSLKEAYRSVAFMNSDPETLKFIASIMENTSAVGSLHILSEPSIPSLVETVRGYNFSVTIPEVFHSSAGETGTRILAKPRVLVIDGFVETMGEIEGPVMRSHSKNQPLIIFARDYNPDVQNTLGKNLSKGLLEVIPLSVPLDITGVKMLEDIGVVAGCEIISALKGDLISSVTWEDMSVLDEAKINMSTGGVEIVNNSTLDHVKSHRSHLRKERLEVDNDIRRLIEVRLSCLQGSGTRVNIGSEWGDLSGLYRDRIEAGVRNYRSCTRWGIIPLDSSDIEEVPLSRAINKLSWAMPHTSAAAVGVGIRAAVDLDKILRRIGGVVHIERRD